MDQSSVVGTKSFRTVAADKSTFVYVSYLFVSFKGSLVAHELAALGAWNLFILLVLLLQHLVVAKMFHHDRVAAIVRQNLQTDMANGFCGILGVLVKEVPYNFL